MFAVRSVYANGVEEVLDCIVPPGKPTWFLDV